MTEEFNSNVQLLEKYQTGYVIKDQFSEECVFKKCCKKYKKKGRHCKNCPKL